MSVFYRKYQNKNRHSVAYGKWFARAVTIGKTINIDELAKHIENSYYLPPFQNFFVSLHHQFKQI